MIPKICTHRTSFIPPLRAVSTTVLALLACLALPHAGWGQEGEVVEDAQEVAAPEAEAEVVEFAVEVIGQDEAVPFDPVVEYLWRYATCERGLIKRVCQPTEQQLAELKAIDKAWLKREIAAVRGKPDANLLEGVGRFLGNLVVPRPANRIDMDLSPRIVATVSKRIDETFLKALDEPRQKQLQTEKTQREKFDRDATADWLLVALDDNLALTAEQRKALRPKLIDWVEKGSVDIQPAWYGGNYLPKIPEPIVEQALTPAQMTAFRAVQKVSVDRLRNELQMMQHDGMPVFLED